MSRSIAKHLGIALAIVVAWVSFAKADYLVKDGGGNTLTIKSETEGSAVLPAATLVDGNFNAFGVSNNPIFVAPGPGQTFTVGGTMSCSNCSGSGVSQTFGNPIGTLGAPGGFKDGSGNFQPNLGDVTNGQWVAIKSSVSLGVTGTFWPYTLGQQVAGSSVPVILPSATIATLTPPAAITGFALETGGNLASLNTKTPALGQALAAASVPVVLTAAQLSTLTPLSSVTANAGTNLNTSLLALETGGNLAAINTKTPALGQALAVSSVPVVLTALQVTALTPPAAITGFALAATQGTTADAPCAVPTTTTACSEIALQKAIANVANGPVTLGSATGGWTRTLFPGITNTAQTVKSSAGQVGKLFCDNPNATAIYVELFDVSGTVTLGTTAPTQAYYIPPTNAAGFSMPVVGDQYSNAIKIAAVTTENGSTAPGTPGNCNVSWN